MSLDPAEMFSDQELHQNCLHATLSPAYRIDEMADRQFNVAIIGAGIGGLALAIGLTHHGVPFTVYESAPAFAAIGAGVGLGPNALRAMDLLDKRFRDNMNTGKQQVNDFMKILSMFSITSLGIKPRRTS